jgi:hypothetical protein
MKCLKPVIYQPTVLGGFSAAGLKLTSRGLDIRVGCVGVSELHSFVSRGLDENDI